jgi:hypothetical protein
MSFKSLISTLLFLSISANLYAQAPTTTANTPTATTATTATSSPQVLLLPLVGNEQLTAELKDSFDLHVRNVMAKKVTLLDDERTRNYLAKVGCNRKTCLDKANLPKIAQEANHRFVLGFNVDKEDEIYVIKMSLYDDATKQNKSLPAENCEFCAEPEVKDKLSKILENPKLMAALSAPAPQVEKPVTPVAPTPVTYKVQISSEPSGAKIFEGNDELGVTPLEIELEANQYQFKAVLANFENLTIPFETPKTPSKDPIVLQFKLKAIALLETAKEPTPRPLEPKVEAVVEDKGTSTPPEKPAILNPYVAGSALVGGILFTGVGGYLLSLHAEMTCADGTARKDCPTLYDTRLPGSILFGAGMAAIGFGSAIYIINHYWPSAPKIIPTKDGASVQWGFEF